MAGRIRRQLIAQRLAAHGPPGDVPADPLCPLCGRPIPADQRDAHHLVPKSKGGRDTTWLHRICHKQIHALFTEAELARSHHTIETLLAHPEMARFVDWVRSKPPGWAGRAFKSQRLRKR